jgi:adenine-specific DNA-methyltransferase
MAKKPSSKVNAVKAKPIKQYEHLDKERVNNPPIGLVNESTDTEYGQNRKSYQYDPHLDPQLQWTGKAERTSFEIPTISLHVHERIDPKTIVDNLRKDRNDDVEQLSLFEKDKKPLREAVEFYKHKEEWSNRLIVGDSLLVMNSLVEKEAMAGKLQMVYFDPPYGIKYGSNFQPFVNKREVKDGNDEDLTQEPEMIKAFRDTWELGIHSYLSYLRDRLLVAKELLNQTGSIFVQISDENLHHVRELMDEVFGKENYCSTIVFRKTGAETTKLAAVITDFLVWYAKDIKKVKYNQLYFEKIPGQEGAKEFKRVELVDGTERAITEEELNNNALIPKGARVFATWPIVSPGYSKENSKDIDFVHEGKKITLRCPPNTHWRVGIDGTKKLWEMGRLLKQEGVRIYKKYLDDFPFSPINSLWVDTRGETNMTYVVQTSQLVIQKCILMTTDPGDLVFDPTCGSGTTAVVSERWGRRWITCDTSRIAIALAKQRLMVADFEYFELNYPEDGVKAGFKYETSENKTMSSVADKIPGIPINLFDRPFVSKSKVRITGPFTCESIPAPFVKNLTDIGDEKSDGDTSISRTGETLRQDEWKDELKRTGVRAKGGAILQFTRIETQEGTKYIQAVGETREAKPQKVLVVFGPEHAPLDSRVVELAIEEARHLKPNILLFCAFQFDEEAAKDIDDTPEKLIGFKLLKAQMNMDLQTDDLKKQRSSNQSFWLIGQPDVRVHELDKGDDKGKIKIEMAGFDYYNPKTGAIDSGGANKIAMWMLDTDYDGRSLFPRQIFFPMAGPKDGWMTLAKNLKAEIDEEKVEAFRGTISLPFKPGKLIAVKIIDDRGIESLKIIKR